ncbi:hypothetical protein ACFFK0_29515 [Paenibacillus chartarius]|uniref:Uncharacterized protein n=1 Tax=Paenibacillus chartarius TaxID=747481 RepID=A0ABV6DV56_9BACL
MWQVEHFLTKKVKAETMWGLYSDITTWTTWDKGFVSATLEGLAALALEKERVCGE